MYEEYLGLINKDHLLEHIRRMTDIAPQRLSGSEEERRIVSYFKEVLERDKVPVTVHEIDAYVSFPGNSNLELISPEARTIPCSTFAQIKPTGEEGIEGQVVYAGQGGWTTIRIWTSKERLSWSSFLILHPARRKSGSPRTRGPSGRS